MIKHMHVQESMVEITNERKKQKRATIIIIHYHRTLLLSSIKSIAVEETSSVCVSLNCLSVHAYCKLNNVLYNRKRCQEKKLVQNKKKYTKKN